VKGEEGLAEQRRLAEEVLVWAVQGGEQLYVEIQDVHTMTIELLVSDKRPVV
jgi:hypothetical protein